jgi:hypothetical protein
MKGKEKITSPTPGAAWTRPDAYIGALARRRSYRHARERKPSNQPAEPRAWLSTIPFAAILALLAVVVVGIVIIAFPGNQPRPKPKQPAVHEQGIAPRGWLQEAQKEMHH